MPKAHAKLSPSSAHCWMNCPGAPDMQAEVTTKEASSVYAAEGTVAHTVAEMCFKRGRGAYEFIGMKIEQGEYGFTVDEEMCDYVQEYVDYVRVHTGDGFLHTEVRLDLTKYIPDGFGTSDNVAYEHDHDHGNHKLHVFDLKYGKGVKVYAEGNEQGMIYALGALGLYPEAETIYIHIGQPRLDHFDCYVISRDKLLMFGEVVRKAAKLANSPGGKLNPGEKQCQWCRAAPECPALHRYNDELLLPMFDDLGAELVSHDKLVELYKNSKQIKKFLEKVEERLTEKLEDGKAVPGVKLVMGRTNRKWTDDAEEHLIGLLGDDAHTRKLISITDAEKALGKGAVDEFTYRPEGQPVLALASDKREEYHTNVVDDFDHVE